TARRLHGGEGGVGRRTMATNLPLAWRIHLVCAAIAPATIPTLASVGVAAALLLSDAAAEPLRFAAQESGFFRFLLLGVSLTLCGATCGYVARFLLYARSKGQRMVVKTYERLATKPTRPPGPAAAVNDLVVATRKWLPRFLTLPPILAAAWSLAAGGLIWKAL